MRLFAASLGIAALLEVAGGCQSSKSPAASNASLSPQAQSAMEARSYQVRRFDIKDRLLMDQLIVDTLLDLGFLIEKADLEMDVISAARYDAEKSGLTEKGKKRTVYPEDYAYQPCVHPLLGEEKFAKRCLRCSQRFYKIDATVVTKSTDSGNTSVRVNMRSGPRDIVEREPYVDFFAALEGNINKSRLLRK